MLEYLAFILITKFHTVSYLDTCLGSASGRKISQRMYKFYSCQLLQHQSSWQGVRD